MTKDKYIGIDLGGTKILTAVANDNGEIIARVKLATETELGQERIKKNIFKSIYKVLEKTDIKIEKIKSIGIGSPGPLNVEKGIIYESANLPIKNMEIVDLIEKETGINTYLQNDANTAALGEKVFGVGKEADDLLYITISTGVGGGIIINGKIYYGHTGNAGEIGHMTVDPTGPQCGCGNYGCLESFSSGTAIKNMAKKAVENDESTLIKKLAKDQKLSAKLAAKAAAKGDQKALDIFAKAGYYLGIGIANLVNIFNPEMIILGGGVLKA
ncbi:MAG TPA: ROK family protein, partial [Halanaerobiales bacterium]|nr:ROK family protein [Halanaerobiales bacterium]